VIGGVAVCILNLALKVRWIISYTSGERGWAAVRALELPCTLWRRE